jgi:hypothetical protein
MPDGNAHKNHLYISICDIGRKYLDDGDGEILKNSAKGESK